MNFTTIDRLKISSTIRRVLTICLLTGVIFSRATSAEAPAADAWWASETLTAVGYGLPSADALTIGRARLSARNAAKSNAYRKLAERAGAIQITATERVRVEEIRAVIVGAKIISEDYDAQGACTIELSVPIYGVSNSIAQTVLTPVAHEEFPAPSSDVGRVVGNYTGLIIDCGELELNPVLAPTIRNVNNQSIYGYSNLDYDAVIARGMIGYEQESVGVVATEAPRGTITEHVIDPKNGNVFWRPMVLGASEESRAGSNPLVVHVIELAEDGSCPVISSRDADRILSENQVSHFLNEGAVVFKSNRIRGMRL